MVQDSKKIWQVVSYIFLAVLMLFVMKKMLGDGIDSVLVQLVSISPFFVTAIIFCALGFCVMDGIAIWQIAKGYKQDFTIAKGIEGSFYASVFRTLTFGMGSAAALIYYLNKKDINPEVGYGIATVSYSFHKVAVALYVRIAMLFNLDFFKANYGEYFKYIFIGCGITVLIVIAILAVCMWSKAHGLIMFFLNKILGKTRFATKLCLVEKKLSTLQSETKKILNNKTKAVMVTGIQMLKISCWYLIPYFAIKGMDAGVTISPAKCVAVVALVVALVGVIPTPGNVASIEIDRKST
ncbi:MAG: lysylphosphatidylglycerol synthase domain-containing protein, partial [Lachnospiraceae bacterium]|nr:lysylphosphatidylglycerol synthase domain-containing protein [Lachnospiraceae bacterium]